MCICKRDGKMRVLGDKILDLGDVIVIHGWPIMKMKVRLRKSARG